MFVRAVGVNLSTADDIRVIDAHGKLVIPGELLRRLDVDDVDVEKLRSQAYASVPTSYIATLY